MKSFLMQLKNAIFVVLGVLVLVFTWWMFDDVGGIGRVWRMKPEFVWGLGLPSVSLVIYFFGLAFSKRPMISLSVIGIIWPALLFLSAVAVLMRLAHTDFEKTHYFYSILGVSLCLGCFFWARASFKGLKEARRLQKIRNHSLEKLYTEK